MNFLEEKIVKEGVVKKGNILKVDSFLNHQMDVKLFRQMGEEFKKRFADKPINKILTVEASGIGIACIVAECFDVPVVFAKKSKSVNIDGEVYNAGHDAGENVIPQLFLFNHYCWTSLERVKWSCTREMTTTIRKNTTAFAWPMPFH